MKTYQEALDWIDKKSKEYGGKNKFYSSDEYRKKYPIIEQLYKESLCSIGKKGTLAMNEVGAKPGQDVYYDRVGAWGHVESQEGTIFCDTHGIPKVKLKSGKSVKWHKGFKPL